MTDVLSPGNGPVPAALASLHEVLTGADNHYRVIQWLRPLRLAALLDSLLHSPRMATRQNDDRVEGGYVGSSPP
ncbi:hypothetical protein [Micromonospora cremea]|uniref:hypothetical protein n=1 Tax=Micromonospora cremea TaxID=709881 RepID=UPI0009415017|nr:hypothetical protein [Micromonospora cremea]